MSSQGEEHASDKDVVHLCYTATRAVGLLIALHFSFFLNVGVWSFSSDGRASKRHGCTPSVCSTRSWPLFSPSAACNDRGVLSAFRQEMPWLFTGRVTFPGSDRVVRVGDLTPTR